MIRKILLLAVMGLGLAAQVPVSLAPPPRLQFFDSNGVPCAGCLLYTYAAGTSTALATYIDSAGTAQNANPITLDSVGSASVWLSGAAYKLVLTTAGGTTIFSVDNIKGNDSTYLRLDGSNGPVTGAVTFSGALNMSAGGALGGTLTGSPTLSGNPYFSGAPTFTGVPLFKTVQSSSANPAASGFLQMATGDKACWRNNANSGDVCLSKNSNGSSGSGATTWLASTSYSIATQVVPAIPNGYYYTSTAAGASGSSAPAWCTTQGCTVTDGTVTWQMTAPTSGLSDQFVFPAIASSSPNSALTGFLNMASGNAIYWRNAANTADIGLTHDASDNLLYNGNVIATPSGSSTPLRYSAATPVTVANTTAATNLQAVTTSSGALNGVGRTFRAVAAFAVPNSVGTSQSAVITFTIGGQTIVPAATVGVSNLSTCSETIYVDGTVSTTGTSGTVQYTWEMVGNCGSIVGTNSGNGGAATMNTTGAIAFQASAALSTASNALSITEPILNVVIQ